MSRGIARKVRESNLKTQCLKWLEKSEHIYAVKNHGSAYSAVGTADLTICVEGRYLAVELKKKGGKPTKIQEWRMEQVRRAGGRAELVGHLDELRLIIWQMTEGD